MTSHFSLADFDVGVFPASYRLARQRWLEALAGVACRQLHLPFACVGCGPEGESLITDTVWLGEEHARRVLVVIAGTHGIEGFAGSAVQFDLLQLLAAGHVLIPDDTAILLIHALTPWGYAWLRRCDGDGVDLNRNCVDFSQPLPENDQYQQLRDALFSENIQHRQSILAEFARIHGRIALEKAISGGQYHDPVGPFYGGEAPAHGRLVCEALIGRYALQERRLAVVDLHTGLGSYGYGEIICDHPPGGAGAAIARHLYGDSVTLPLDGTSSSVPKRGLLDYLWHAIMDSQGCFITLEFGTYSTDQLFEVLLRDHQLWAKPENAFERQVQSQLMLQHFCPNDPAWQEMLLFRARQVIGQALRGLSV